jgi:hypothetical protein
MMFAGLWIFLPMLFDELRNLVFGDGFFKVHIMAAGLLGNSWLFQSC